MARKGDGIRLRGKTYWLDFIHKGERYQVRLGKRINRTAAQELAVTERIKILKGEAGIGRRKRRDISFEKAAELFLRWAQANRAPGTATFHQYGVQGLKRSFEKKKLGEIVPFLIERHKQMRKAEGHLVQANHELATLSAIFNRCIEWEKFDGKNPVARRGNKGIQRFKEPEERPRFLTDEEEESLLAECGEPLRSIVLIGVYTGLRVKSEILTLRPENIDLAGRIVTVEGAYAKNRKTAGIPMHSRLVEVFQRFLSQAKGEFLFSHSNGDRLKEIRFGFKEACKRAKIKNVTPHVLRHTFATRLDAEGVGSVTLQKLGRWETASMIKKYVHPSSSHLAEAIERLGSKNSTTLARNDTLVAISQVKGKVG